MKTNFGKVALLLGGKSAEREISLKSGAAVLKALQENGVQVVRLDTGEPFIQTLIEGQFDRVFIALHGRGGEDGTIQGLLELLKLPYTGSGVLGSALGMDKLRTKELWHGMGLPTPPWIHLQADSDFNHVVAQLGLPLMVKPVLEGSSVGMTKVTQAEKLRDAWQIASQYHCPVIAEKFIHGAEYTASILQDSPLPLIRLETPRDFYDYTAKYTDNQTRYHCPCGLPAEREHAMQQLALTAFKAIGGRGWGRVDLMTDAQGNPWLLEVNTIPGMTDHSLVPMAARVAGIDFNELVGRILETATLS